MPLQVGVDPEGLFGVVATIEEQPRTEPDGPLVLTVEGARRLHGEVEVQLLGDTGVWPGRSRQAVDRLDGEASPAAGSDQDEPVGASGIGLAGGRWRVALPVVPAEQRS